MTISAVIFDVGDTLWKLGPLERVEQRLAGRLATRAHLGHAAATKIVTATLNEARAIAAGESGAEPDIARELSAAAEQLGVGLSMQTAAEVHRELGWADIERFVPNAALREILVHVRERGVRLAAVSNTWTPAALLEGYFGAIGISRFFDAFVFSSALGIRKPHPAIYEQALAALEVEPNCVLFIGDRLREDVEGPTRLGMRAVLTHEFRQEEPGEARVLASLAEVPGLLDALNSASGE